MIFDLYEDVLSHSWHRFYYGVEAETIEEAIEEVKNGKQDCYDSELLYETVIELSPEDNEFYFGSNEFHKFSFKDIVGTFEKAESISEEERDTICQLFGDSRGLTFTDEVLDIIGIRNV